MQMIKYLARSRKFWIAVVSMVSVVLVGLGRPELPVESIVDSIEVIAGVLIAAIAIEDAGRHIGSK